MTPEELKERRRERAKRPDPAIVQKWFEADQKMAAERHQHYMRMAIEQKKQDEIHALIATLSYLFCLTLGIVSLVLIFW